MAVRISFSFHKDFVKKKQGLAMKRIIVICLVFLFSSVSLAAAENTQKKVTRIALPNSYTVRMNDGFHDMDLVPGFRDMNFGDTVSKLGPNAKLLDVVDDGQKKLYQRTTDKLKVGSIPLRLIVYQFQKNMLTVVRLYSNIEDLVAMKELCESKYGDGIKRKDETNGKPQYVWLTGTGLISLSETKAGAQLSICDLAIQILADSDISEEEIVLLPGIRYIRIGHPFKAYESDLKAIWEDEPGHGTYIRPSENLKIANCQVDSIEYHFTKQFLTMITVKGNKDCFDELADMCIIRYGKPEEAFVIEEGDFRSLRYSWKLNITDILLTKEDDSATLMIYSLPLIKALDEKYRTAQ